jgi:hypothetical protein
MTGVPAPVNLVIVTSTMRTGFSTGTEDPSTERAYRESAGRVGRGSWTSPGSAP